VPRALARAALLDRVHAEVLNERRRGIQAVDWHEGMTAARAQILEEITRLEQNGPAVRALDLSRMRRLAENWPTDGWHREDIIEQYRLALLRGISVGHFLRRASGGMHSSTESSVRRRLVRPNWRCHRAAQPISGNPR